QMLRAVRSLPGEFASRQEAIEGLGRFGFAPDAAQWMTTNLERTDGRYRWRLDFDALEQLLRDFFQTDLWSTVTRPPESVTLHFVKASQSDALSPDALERLERITEHPSTFVHTVPGGHWITADNPNSIVHITTSVA